MSTSSNDVREHRVTDPTVEGLTMTLRGVTAEVRDWADLEDACRELIKAAAGDRHTVAVPTQRTDSIDTILHRIDTRRRAQSEANRL